MFPQPLRLPTHPREVNTAVRLGASKAARPLELARPILLATESFGMLSKPARMALAQASRLAGTAISISARRMLPEERQAGNIAGFSISFPDSPGWNSQDLLQAEALELIFSQGAGMGGTILDGKIIEITIRYRVGPKTLIATVPTVTRTFSGLTIWLAESRKFREATDWQVPISLKMAMGRVTEDIRLAVEVKADIVRLDGVGVGHRRSFPKQVREHIGLPTVCGLAEARRALTENGWEDRLDIVVGGGIRDGADVAKALALGAKAVHVDLGALMALGCTGCGTCFTGDCPQGLATQDPELMKKLDIEVAAQGVYNYLTSLNEEIKLICAVLGKSDIAELGVEDLQATTIEASTMTGLPLVGTGKVF